MMVLLVACAAARRKPRLYELVSIVLALLGVTLLTTHGDLTTFAVSPVALIAGVGSAVCVTVYNCLGPAARSCARIRSACCSRGRF